MQQRASILIDTSCEELRHDLSSTLRAWPQTHVDLSESPLAIDWGRFDGADLAILCADNASGWPVTPLLTALREREPAITVLLLGSGWPPVPRVIHELARAGGDRFHSIRAAADWEAVHSVAKRRLLAPAPREALAALARHGLPAGLRALVMHCVRNAPWHWTQDSIAWFFGRTIQALNSRLHRTGFHRSDSSSVGAWTSMPRSWNDTASVTSARSRDVSAFPARSRCRLADGACTATSATPRVPGL